MTHLDDEHIDSLLGQLDHPPPTVNANDIMAAASAPARRRSWSPFAKAAGILLALTVAGAAYAIPGSPVRAWVTALVSRFTRAEAPPDLPVVNPDPVRAGIRVAPGASLVIRFTSRQVMGEARVILTDDAEVAVEARNGAAIFTSGVDRLDVDNRGSTATFDIRIPRTAPQVAIEVDGARVFLKRGSHVESRATPDSAGAYVLQLSQRPDPRAP